MKISLNTLRFYRNKYNWAGEPAPEGVEKLVEKIGAQLGAVEEVIDFGAKYQGVVVVKIVKCSPHPNADRLSICTIDDGGITPDVNRGEDGFVQVVCGAPNVRENLTVAWLPPGSTVPESYDKDPFVLEARELRGVTSNGMLASAKELAISDSHDGILEIEEDIKPGTMFVDAFGLRDEKIIDIENKMFTHRPDCFGWLGVAREIAGIQGQKFTSPEWYSADVKIEAAQNELTVHVQNELPELVQRFVLLPINNITVKPSPVWLQVELMKVGLRPINNIVDLTNYHMVLTGQPLHAYDYDKVKARSNGEATIVVRRPHEGEKIKLLNGKEVAPRAEAIMIATDKELIGIGGVMGGADTEVDENTKNIILEAANFDMYSVRRTSMTHGLFTDAVTRFTKGQSPLQNVVIIAKIAEDVTKLAGGQIAGQLVDDNHLASEIMERKALYAPIQISAAFINERLGLNLNTEEIAKLLENVEFKVGQIEMNLSITAPFWRTDIEIPEDIVEEVGRLYGYDHLPLELPKRTIRPTQKDPLLTMKAKIRASLSKAGANELLTYSFVHGNLLDKVGQDKAQAFELSNALSPDLQYYRLSLQPSLLEKIHPNIKAGYDEFALFEIGKTHSVDRKNDQGLPTEDEITAFVLTAADKLHKEGSPYYAARTYLEALVGSGVLEFKSIGEGAAHYPIVQPYALNRSAFVSLKGGEFLGIIGEFKTSVSKVLKLPKYSAGFEVDTSVLGSALLSSTSYTPLSRFPSITQDVTLKVAADISNSTIQDLFYTEIDKLKQQKYLASVHGVDIYQDDNKSLKNVTFRMTVSSYERTLRDIEITKMLEAIVALAKEEFGAERV